MRVSASPTALTIGRATRRLRIRARRLLVCQYRRLARFYGGVRTRQRSFGAPSAPSFLRRSDAHINLRIGLDHVRAGRLRQAVDALERADALAPHNERTEQLARQAAGDLRVLSGRWAAPDLGVRRIQPVAGRVLHVVSKSLPFQSGYTIRTSAIVAAQREIGLDPHVATDEAFRGTEDDQVVPGEEVRNGIVHHRLPGIQGRSPGLDHRLDHRIAEGAAVVERVKPAVLHAASDLLNAQAALAWGRSYDLPVVYEVRGFWEETWLSGGRGADGQTSDLYLGRKARERACMTAADAVVTLAEVMRAEIVDRGVDDSKVVVIPNAVDTAVFSPGARDVRLAASLGIGPTDVTVGYITSMTPYEAIEQLIDAVALLLRAGRPVKGLLVGDGTQRRSLEERCRQLGIADHVVFAGQVPHDQVPTYYRLLDVFVVPRSAARVCELVTPLKPYEAMATALPVVVSNVAALREMVIDGETGIVYHDASGGLAEVIDSLIAAPDERERLGRNARAWVSEHRTWRGNAEKYLDLYRRLGAA